MVRQMGLSLGLRKRGFRGGMVQFDDNFFTT